MPETTPLIKAALNLRGGAGFDVYGYSVILNNNQKLVVPRARYKDVKSAFIAYKGEV